MWGLSLDTGEVRPFACGSPRCEACAPRWGRMLRARLARVLPQMVGPAWRGTPLKFGTFTLPPEIDAGRPSHYVVETESVAWRRLMRFCSAADPRGRVFVWKREVGARGGRRLHRHVALVTRLSNIALKRLAWRAGYGRVVNFKRATGGALSKSGPPLASNALARPTKVNLSPLSVLPKSPLKVQGVVMSKLYSATF